MELVIDDTGDKTGKPQVEAHDRLRISTVLTC